MKSIKNNLELLHIKEMMDNDRFCLTNALLDAEKATGDKINDLDIDGIENTVRVNVYNMFMFLVDLGVFPSFQNGWID